MYQYTEQLELKGFVDMEYYYNEDKTKVAVLITSHFGIGWSTDNADGIKLALDKRIIEYWMNHKDFQDVMSENEIIKKMEEFGYNVDCAYGWKHLDVVWVARGSMFRIKEYDGLESIEFFDPQDWVMV